MKNVQVRFSDEVYQGLERIAQEEHTTLADIVRRGLQLYGILREYRKEGRKLALIDEAGQVQAELIIPGITHTNPAPKTSSASAGQINLSESPDAEK